MLKNEPTLAIRGVDTAENEPCKVCPLSVYRSPRFDPESPDLQEALASKDDKGRTRYHGFKS